MNYPEASLEEFFRSKVYRPKITKYFVNEHHKNAHKKSFSIHLFSSISVNSSFSQETFTNLSNANMGVRSRK